MNLAERAQGFVAVRFFVSRWREAALLLALAALILAIWLPQFVLPRPVHHYQVTFDISQSMNVSDVGTADNTLTRLELAKDAAQLLLRELPCGSRVGWSVFTGQRTIPLVVPLEICEHYGGLSSSLELIGGKMRWFNGSSVGKGLHHSIRAASAIGDHAAVIMISDGHEAPPLRPGQKGIPKNEGLGIKGLLVGVGGDNAVPIPKTDEEGRQTGFWQAHEVAQLPGVTGRPSQEELSRLKSEHMIQLSQLAGLEYIRLTQPEELHTAVKTLGIAQKAPAPVDLSWVPAGFALLFLCWRYLPVGRISFTRQNSHSAKPG
ncbi:MAG: VWA domain-containing protein [Gammaproteobacteria bacterium]|nr:VWA domain-containing protein [Gammaproteobacteria bacterium]